jgi:CheY-like chemotaxis protein
MGLGRTILVADDNWDDVELLERCLRGVPIHNPIYKLRTGDDVITYLRGETPEADRTKPSMPWMVMLDLDMPGKDGFQVLEWIRSQPRLSRMRVVMLTGSDHIKDMTRAYRLGANSFLVKPVRTQDIINLAMAVRDGWEFGKTGP